MKWPLFSLAAMMLLAGLLGLKSLPTAGQADQVRESSNNETLAIADTAPESERSQPAKDDLARFAALVLEENEAVEDDPDNLEDDLALIDQPLRWHTDFETVLALAERADKPIFVRFR